MTTAGAFWKWFSVGCLIAAVILVAQAMSVGGAGGLLQVGETSDLRPIIENELGEVPLAPGPGHDGQIYYAIGIDLLGEEVPDLLDHGAYRYRRILFPFIAAVGGLLDGYALLYSMIVVTIVATGATAGAVAAIAARQGRTDWLAVSVLLNPGVWLSVRLLTADTVALAFMVLALMAYASNRTRSIAGFSLSALSKDVSLATPSGLALTRERRAWAEFLVPAAVLVAWMTWLTVTMGDGFTGRGNLTWPLAGIVQASSVWSSFDAAEWVYLIFALGSVAAGLFFGLTRQGWLRFSLLAWSILAVISSNWVWDFGNNAARAFAPIAILIALSYAPAAVSASRAANVNALGR